MRWLRNRYFLATDVLLLPLAGYLSYVLRLEGFDWAVYGVGFLLLVGLACVIVPIVFRRAGIYSRYWRYASVDEMLLLAGSVIVAVLLTGAISLAAVQLLPAKPPLPRSIPLIFLLLAVVATAGPRFAVRLSARSTLRKRSNGKEHGARPRPVLIMGAGDAGAMIVRELRSNPNLGLEPVGFLDDDLGKHDVKIHGVPVLGDRHAIPAAVKKHQVGQVIIAMPTAPGAAIRDIVRICGEAGVQARTIPGIYELLDGSVSVKQVRDVRIEDLLRRAPVQTDISAVDVLLRGKRVLVTGGGGSIGAELCRQILRCDPARLIILGHGENSVFEIVEELRTAYPQLGPKLVPVIAGTRFPARIRAVFAEQRPEIVFHAAAHKHVPLMEGNPGEAITNNVLGTRSVLDAALASGVERFVMISTDKAVNPTNIMGASKRAAELLVHQAAQGSGRPYVAVRFGNVLGSRGSVVHTFRRQIAAGGPVTVTHPDMRRYFMTIPEAVQLVLQAAVLGQGGEVFVLDMGEPIKIADLAHDLIRLSGLRPGVRRGEDERGRGGEEEKMRGGEEEKGRGGAGEEWDIEVVYTGLRPGEKLFEELFIPGESYVRTAHQKIFVASNGAANAACCVGLDEKVDRMIAAAECGDRAAIVQAMQALVPEYQPAGAERVRG
jgi:FlaA1/EpsC-like NDP-sugar epimerase